MATFFFSYSSSDRDNEPYVDQFWRDLSRRVDELTPVHQRPTGFRDNVNIPWGGHWRPELLNALNGCRVLVPLVSEGLFASPNCGLEWTFFLRRWAAWRQAGGQGGDLPVILPVLWLPCVTRVPALQDLQYNHSDFTSAYPDYQKRGIQNLMRVRGKPDNDAIYQDLVGRLAYKIVEAVSGGTSLPVLDPVPDIDTIESAFHPPATNGNIARRPPATGIPDHVRFVIVAGNVTELGVVRNDTHQYGTTSLRWCPFSPQTDERVAVIAQQIAASKDGSQMTSEVLAPDTELGAVVEQARERGDLVVLLVDPWTLKLPDYRSRMEVHDGRSLVSQTLLAAYNEEDVETAQSMSVLKDLVVATLPGQTGGDADHLVCGSAAKLRSNLAAALVAAQGRVMMATAAARRAGAGTPIPSIDATKASA